MEVFKPLSGFFYAIRKDGRISITHIGIYVSLIQHWQDHECQNPIRAYSHEVMKIAKISAGSTYHKCIRDLHDFGYIRYEPSFNKQERSKVYLIFW